MRYSPRPIHGSDPVRPVFSVARFSPFWKIATVCLSIAGSKGPAIAQSCGTDTAAQSSPVRENSQFESVATDAASSRLSMSRPQT